MTTSSGAPSESTLPSERTTILSANLAARLMSWHIATTSIPSETAASLSRPIVSYWWRTSRLDVGSSRSRTSGSCASPLAISTFWRCPADSRSVRLPARSSMPSILMQRAAISRSRDLVPGPDRGCLPVITVSRTVLGNASSEPWETSAILLARSLRGMPSRPSPSSDTLPASGDIRRTSARMSVDFPTPLGPMMHVRPAPSSDRDRPSHTEASP